MSYDALHTADSIGPDRFASRVVGRYHFRLITTEGAGVGKRVREGLLVVADQAPGTSSGGFDLTLTATWGGFLHKRIRRLLRAEVSHWRGSYWPPDSLTLREVDTAQQVGAVRLDGFGRFATVAEIDSTGRWVGRFEDGNYVVLGQPSPIGPLAERESGYFCAWPLKPR